MMKSEFDTEAFLAHHGTKGMKWGIRKDGKPQGYQGGGKTSKDFRPRTEKKSVRLKKNSSTSTSRVRTDMSNEELRKVNDRLRLEIDYNRNVSELKKQTMTASEKTREAVKEVLSRSAKQAATQLLTAKATQVGAQKMGLKVKEKNKD